MCVVDVALVRRRVAALGGEYTDDLEREYGLRRHPISGEVMPSAQKAGDSDDPHRVPDLEKRLTYESPILFAAPPDSVDTGHRWIEVPASRTPGASSARQHLRTASPLHLWLRNRALKVCIR